MHKLNSNLGDCNYRKVIIYMAVEENKKNEDS